MRRKSCFSSDSYICGLTENFPQFTLLKKCNTPKLYAALLHTLISQPIVSESYSPFHQTSELMKLRLNNNVLAGAFQTYFAVLWILYLDCAGTQTKVLSFDLVLRQDQKRQLWIQGSVAVTVGRGQISSTQSLQETSLGATLGRKVEENQGHFKAGTKDIVRSGVSNMCLGDVAEN